MNPGPCFFCRPGYPLEPGRRVGVEGGPLCDPCAAELAAFRLWLRSICSSLR
jgi:hypothetical protein